MVAISGTGWNLAPSLIALIEQTDDLYPTRDRASDGSIGDAAHASRESQHNPENGWVCAVDLDEDLSAGLHSLNELARHLVDIRDHRVRYLIYEGRICKSYVDAAGRAAWVWQTYTGLNDHSHHLHVSIWNTPAARDDTGPWWPEEDDMPSTDELIAALNKAADEGKLDDFFKRQRKIDMGSGGVLDDILAIVKATDSRVKDLQDG